MPVPEAAEATPWVAQIGAVVAAVGSLCAILIKALGGQAKSPDETRTTTETVHISDDNVWFKRFDRIEVHVKRTADNSDIMLALARKRLEEDELQRIKADARVEAQEDETRRRLNESLARIDEAERKRQPRGETT